jgi:hypothetical protein
MTGSSCSGGTLLAVIEAAPAAELLSCGLPAELDPGEGAEAAGQPAASSRPCDVTASMSRTL